MTSAASPSASIPVIDLARFLGGSPADRADFVQQLGHAFRHVGFVAVRNHLLPADLVSQLYAQSQAFFALPDAVKQRYVVPGGAGQRGYTPKGQEHAKGQNTGDLKEFYHIGQTLHPGDPLQAVYPENIFPEELPDFRAVMLTAYQKLEATGAALLQAIALHLDLPEHYFSPHIQGGNSILRPIHYFPIEDPDSLSEGAVRAAAHEDINLITLLMGASADGLEILSAQGTWVAVTVVPDALVVNVGDMLQRLTNNMLHSTTHRVVNPPRALMGTSRYSMPFFMHPRPEMDLTCLPQCVTATTPAAYPPITAGGYLNERLREIGLLK